MFLVPTFLRISTVVHTHVAIQVVYYNNIVWNVWNVKMLTVFF